MSLSTFKTQFKFCSFFAANLKANCCLCSLEDSCCSIYCQMCLKTQSDTFLWFSQLYSFAHKTEHTKINGIVVDGTFFVKLLESNTCRSLVQLREANFYRHPIKSRQSCFYIFLTHTNTHTLSLTQTHTRTHTHTYTHHTLLHTHIHVWTHEISEFLVCRKKGNFCILLRTLSSVNALIYEFCIK